MLRMLNRAGYGVEGSGLELNLVANPAGAFLPPSQRPLEERFRRELARKWGVTFNSLYAFANVPLGRFRRWLADSGNYDGYLKSLAGGFNPCTVAGLMCRTLLSVSWDGYLFDCDFHLAAGRHMGDRKIHVSEVREIPSPGTPIAAGEYCYACTAAAGFT
jgi:radical SAM/Cys-rich protein